MFDPEHIISLFPRQNKAQFNKIFELRAQVSSYRETLLGVEKEIRKRDEAVTNELKTIQQLYNEKLKTIDNLRKLVGRTFRNLLLLLC